MIRWLLLFCLVSCQQDIVVKRDANNSIFGVLVGTHQVELLGGIQKNREYHLDSPPFTWKPLGVFSVYTDKDHIPANYCLLFKLPGMSNGRPMEGQEGVLKLVSMKPENSCEDLWSQDSDYMLKGWRSLYFEYQEYTTGGGRLRFKGLRVVGMKTKQEDLSMELLNLTLSSTPKPMSNSSSLRRYKGIVFSSLKSEINSKVSVVEKDWINSGEYCHQVNDDCEDVLLNQCDRLCKNGWTEVVASNCPYRRSKVCGVSICGEKNQPACVKGTSLSNSNFPYCSAKKGWAFCQDDMLPLCDEEKKVVCL